MMYMLFCEITQLRWNRSINVFESWSLFTVCSHLISLVLLFAESPQEKRRYPIWPLLENDLREKTSHRKVRFETWREV